MTVRPIRTEQDYRLALKQIDKLVDCPDNGEEADELDILSVLIENYESKHYPIAPPDPTNTIRFRIEQL